MVFDNSLVKQEQSIGVWNMSLSSKGVPTLTETSESEAVLLVFVLLLFFYLFQLTYLSYHILVFLSVPIVSHRSMVYDQDHESYGSTNLRSGCVFFSKPLVQDSSTFLVPHMTDPYLPWSRLQSLDETLQAHTPPRSSSRWTFSSPASSHPRWQQLAPPRSTLAASLTGLAWQRVWSLWASRPLSGALAPFLGTRCHTRPGTAATNSMPVGLSASVWPPRHVQGVSHW